jgi:hypothetical protein
MLAVKFGLKFFPSFFQSIFFVLMLQTMHLNNFCICNSIVEFCFNALTQYLTAIQYLTANNNKRHQEDESNGPHVNNWTENKKKAIAIEQIILSHISFFLLILNN